jgi:hypothetical protein
MYSAGGFTLIFKMETMKFEKIQVTAGGVRIT